MRRLNYINLLGAAYLFLAFLPFNTAARNLPEDVHAQFVYSCELMCQPSNNSKRTQEFCSCACNDIATNMSLEQLERYEQGNGSPVGQIAEAFQNCSKLNEK